MPPLSARIAARRRKAPVDNRKPTINLPGKKPVKGLKPLPTPKKPVYGAPAPLPNPGRKSPALGRNKGKVGKPDLMPSGPRKPVPFGRKGK